MSAEPVEGKVQIKMRASVGALRSQGTYWVEPDRAGRLVGKRLASYLAPPAKVDVLDAIATVAAEMRAGHRMQTNTAAPEDAKEVQADGSKTDESAGKARARRRAGNGDGSGDPAGRLDQQTDGKQG